MFAYRKLTGTYQMMEDQLDYLMPDSKLMAIEVTQDDMYQNFGSKKRRVYQNVEYSEWERKKIQQMRIWSQNKFDLKDVPDKVILRYLYSYDFNHEQALEKIKVYLNWYKDPSIQRFDNVTLQLINKGVIYTYGRDKKHRPVIYFNVTLFDPQKYNINDYLSAMNAVVTLVVQKMFIKGKIQNYLFIIDTGNQGFSSLPIGVTKQLTLRLSHIYSMRMGTLLIINCNYLIKLMYSAVSPFLAESTKQKISLYSKSQTKQGKLKEFIDGDQIQQKYGGNRANLQQKWPPRLPGKQFKTIEQLRQIQRQSKRIKFESNQSSYYSIENNEQRFEKIYGQNPAIEGCCQNNACMIY